MQHNTISKVIYLTCGVIFLTCNILAIACTDDERWAERQERIRQVADGEIQRQHSLALARIKAEVLGRLQILRSSNININNSNISSNKTGVTVDVEASNEL